MKKFRTEINIVLVAMLLAMVIMTVSLTSCLKFNPMEPWPEDERIPCAMQPGCR